MLSTRGVCRALVILLIMKRLGIQSARSVAKVGDTWADLEEGGNADCGLNIGVSSGSFTREQLLARPHSHILDSVADVPPIVFAAK